MGRLETNGRKTHITKSDNAGYSALILSQEVTIPSFFSKNSRCNFESDKKLRKFFLRIQREMVDASI